MTLFTSSDRMRIARAIQAAESHTSGEIVCVLARAASDYRAIPVLWAAIIALVVPWPLIRWTVMSAELIHLSQMALFCVLALLLSFAPFRYALVPGRFKLGRAREAAREQFTVQGLYRTKASTGVLIYLAEAERYAEIIADEAITAKVDATVWRQAIEALTDSLKDGQRVDGLIEAIAICGRVLSEHAPPGFENPNELPNRLIIL